MNGEKIKIGRENLGLTQSELGKELGISKNTIYNYENGGKIPDTKIPILVKFFEDKLYLKKSDSNSSLTEEPISEYTKLSLMERATLDLVDEVYIKFLKQKINVLEKKVEILIEKIKI